MSFTY
jgi:hypothetical protein